MPHTYWMNISNFKSRYRYAILKRVSAFETRNSSIILLVGFTTDIVYFLEKNSFVEVEFKYVQVRLPGNTFLFFVKKKLFFFQQFQFDKGFSLVEEIIVIKLQVILE